MLWRDRLIRHYLRICDKTSVAIFHREKVYLNPGIPTIVSDEVGVSFSEGGVHYGELTRFRIMKNTPTIGVTWLVSETIMAAATVFRSS
ncbi:unnamed protein product [Heligmosomoides polygyrus]|uniref:PRELI/MSF1 domain-containing protein n=1 Tax=Heligmosomoides polygyrus TaxID=6339 RepID=A0A183GBQ6_HELPZ|nr:unnamed protein product [Heligmosomoides polygyrus]